MRSLLRLPFLVTLTRSLPALTFLLISLVGANGLPVLVDPPPDAALEDALLVETNVARTRFGLEPLQPLEGLARAARGHAQEMAELHFFSHTSPNPSSSTLQRRLARAGVASTTAGENLALLRGQEDPAAAAVEGWLQSPPHREALLNGEYTHVGFGAFRSDQGELFIAQVFSREPRRLLNAQVSRETRNGFDLRVEVEVPQPLTVVARLGDVVGEPLTLAPGRERLELYSSSSELQQLVLAVALDSEGHYQIQDGGWIDPGKGSWRADGSMPRSALVIETVEAERTVDEVFRLELFYEAAGGELAVMVDGRHVEGAEFAPGRLRIYLPSDAVSEVRVGELVGRMVDPFDRFTVSPGVGGPQVRAGVI